MNKSIEELLDMDAWKVGLAAWIFAGYSPLRKQKSGLIVRLADEIEIPFGTTEYRGAEDRKNQIKDYLVARIAASRGERSVDERQRFDRNWMISCALAPDNSGTFVGSIDVFWAKWACKEHYLPAYVVPGALTIDEVKERGHFTWRTPSSGNDRAQPPYLRGGYGAGPYYPELEFVHEGINLVGRRKSHGSIETQYKTIREGITPLFVPSGIYPSQYDDGKPEHELYWWFYETIEKLISEAPDRQDLEVKHSAPRPTAAVARDIIIEAGNIKRSGDERWCWWFYKAERGGALCWFYDRSHSDGKQRDPKDDFRLTMSTLNSRLRDWFIKTPEGIQYDELHGNNKEKFFKSKNDLKALN